MGWLAHPALAVLSLAACSEAPSQFGAGQDAGTGGQDSGDTATLSQPWDLAFTISDNPDNPFSVLVSLVPDRDATVWVTYTVDDGERRETPGFVATAGQAVELVVLGLHAEAALSLQVAAQDSSGLWLTDSVELDTAALPESYTGCSTSGEASALDPDDSQVVCTSGRLEPDLGGIMCFDRQGRPVHWLANPGLASLEAMAPLAEGGVATVSFHASQLDLFDSASRRTGTVSSSWLSGRTRFVQERINGHDVIALTHGQWAGALAVLTWTSDQVTGVGQVVAAGIVVLDPVSLEVLWDWNLHGELGDDQPIDGGDWYDLSCSEDAKCLHVNALVHGRGADGGERFWLNFNALHWLVEVDPGTDSLSWRLGYLGDFKLVDGLEADAAGLPDRDWMFNHHAPELDWLDSGLLRVRVFDNGSQVPTGVADRGAEAPYSRALELTVDVERRVAMPSFSWGSADAASADFMYGAICGDMDQVGQGESLLVLQGAEDPFVAQVDRATGEELWRLSCPSWSSLYRSQLFDSIYDVGGG